VGDSTSCLKRAERGGSGGDREITGVGVDEAVDPIQHARNTAFITHVRSLAVPSPCRMLEVNSLTLNNYLNPTALFIHLR
jgi:hypothetical protein